LRPGVEEELLPSEYQWELYNINEDVTEFNDLAAKMGLS
jgi:hypothetical protein